MPTTPTSQQPFFYDGFASPNFTQVPDDLFDVLLPVLTDPELRVLLYIIRRTFGFKKQSDEISLRQMVEGITTKDGRVLDRGVGVSKATVARALKGLQAKGIVVATRNRSVIRGNEPTTYSLRFQATPCLSRETRGDVSPVRQALVSPADPQYTDTQQTVLSSKAFHFAKGRRAAKTAPSAIGHVLRTRYAAPRREKPGMSAAEGRITAEPASPAARSKARRTHRAVAPPRLAQVMTELSAELHDVQHARSNISQATRLHAESGLDERAFVGLLYEARSITKDRLLSRSSNDRVKRAMPYFYAVLKDLLGEAGAGDGKVEPVEDGA
jgi:hypothetical protein